MGIYREGVFFLGVWFFGWYIRELNEFICGGYVVNFGG